LRLLGEDGGEKVDANGDSDINNLFGAPKKKRRISLNLKIIYHIVIHLHLRIFDQN
jgi:hypothetical protein